MTVSERFKLPPREGWTGDLTMRRRAPFTLVRDDSGEAGDGNTLDGYAAVFNRETIIDSWEGKFKEQVAPGSMKKSFRDAPPIIQFDHGRHVLIGSIPIGQHEPGSPREETDPERAPEGGAHVIARLHDNWLIQPLRDAIKSESIDGMSFRFMVVREEWRDHTGKRITDEDALRAELRRTWYEDVPDDELLLRTLKELGVPELGPVVWPAYAETSVGVRSMVAHLGEIVPDLSDLLAASSAQSTDGEDPDAERQAAEASARQMSRRQRADHDALLIRRVPVLTRKEADHG